MASGPVLEVSDATTVDSTTDDDDLGSTRPIRTTSPPRAKSLFKFESRPSKAERPSPRPVHSTPASAHVKQTSPPEGKVPLEEVTTDGSASDDDIFNDGKSVYEEFKNRKSRKRKRSSVGVRKVKTKVAAADAIVGRAPKSEGKVGKPKRWGEYGDEMPSKDELMEHTLPEYLQKRRLQFDRRREHLKDSGLKLPPEYDHIDFSDDENLEFLQEKPKFRDITPCNEYKDITLPYSLGLIPAPVAQWLRPYQVEGAAFLHELFVYQKGGILGDDMGLGKTVQVIAFLTAAYGKTGDERDEKRMRKMRRSEGNEWYPRTLIVCPGTLINNWKSELSGWGWWNVDAYHGGNKDLVLHAARSGRIEIMITTYSTYLSNKDSVNMVDWDCVIADECHAIKERTSETTKAMNEINALCRIGLTGTAIQNKYEELWTLLNWTNPGRLGPVTTWKRTVSDPLKMGQSHDATIQELRKARITAKKLVQNLLPQFFLRRMKTLIADQLPKKIDRVVFCPLTETQAEAYENLVNSDIISYIKTSSNMCDCGSGKKAGWCCRQYLPSGGRWQNYVFPAILILQKLSNHLAILIPQGTDSFEKQEKDKEMLEVAVPNQWESLYRSRDSLINFANPEFCGKWKVLKRLLRWWNANGDKVLVFSHSVRLLKMLEMLFKNTSYNVSYLDGSMSYEDRTTVVDGFNADPRQFVFLISTRSGGVGLNITSANKVVIVDPNWNPSYDLQAQDRAYRIGQTRDVEVFRLISAGTVEEIVYARQIYKQQQANIGYNASSERRYFKGVQEKKDKKGEIFGLVNIFEYQNDNIVLRDIVNKTNIAESKAGVQVMNVEFDETEPASEDGPKIKTQSSDDEVMSQLAAKIRGEDEHSPSTPTKHDPIQAILAGAGVEYTHLNNEVIGSSKIEEQLSRRAQLADDDMANMQVFGGSQNERVSSPAFQRNGHPVQFRYHPPEDVMRRQFCSMGKRFGFPNATEFALVVEGMTQAQRRACLERWYRERREILLGEPVKAEQSIKDELSIKDEPIKDEAT
ncbi:P-loop containing nucleoside triphosphate hydrolase protein [Aspergillus pseudoustus]|uniref:P-loop containing nucleoside triphosphate hydrolase protein n=1 Tax=Aspergillus pseudoustus TaxID=1810923 RepID=A0ABR4KXW6_9EURO